MPLYAVSTKGSKALRLIDATSESAALKHAAAGQFAARRVTKPTEVGELMSAGASIEKAGEPVAQAERVNIETGQFERQAGETWEIVRPATLAELAEADPAGRWRVDVVGGMLRRHVGEGADDDDANWSDLREATAEEIAEAMPPKAKK